MNLFLVLAGLVILSLILAFLINVIKKFEQGGKVEELLPFKLKNNFFTRSEWEFFRILEEQIDHTKYTVFPKVRLGDFVEVDAPKGERMSHWNRIKSKHVDFLIYDTQKSSIAIAVELDGNSHNSERMKKSDDFKDKLYPAVGLELIRVQVGSDFAGEIQRIIQNLKN